jgi:hypothetical protein
MHQFWRKWFDGAPAKPCSGARFNIGRLEKQRCEQRQKTKFNVQTDFTVRCVYATVEDAIKTRFNFTENKIGEEDVYDTYWFVT